LALALMHELIHHDLLDHDYLDRHVQGWPALRERALQWPPERAAEVCGLPAQQIRDLAQLYGRTQPAAIRLNYGMQRARGGGNAVRLVALLPCLTGAWRHRGGGMLLSASGWFGPAVDSAALERPDLMPQPLPRVINMSTIGEDLLREASAGFGPRIEAVVVYNSNPVAVAPQSRQVVAGFAREDLFTVVLEHFMTDTADLADIVLPATTQLEHLDVHRSYGLTSPALPTATKPWRARPSSRIRWISISSAPGAGCACPCRSSPSPTAAFPRPPGGPGPITRSGACPMPCPTTRAQSPPRTWPRATPWP